MFDMGSVTRNWAEKAKPEWNKAEGTSQNYYF
jgi:hypothetical protein